MRTLILKRSLLIVALLIIPMIQQGQDGVDFNHRTFTRALRKAFGKNNYELRMLEGNKHSSKGNRSGRYYTIISQESHQLKYAYIGRVNTCRAGGCSVNGKTSADATSEYFDYYILFDAAYRVAGLRIFNYQASYGFEITSPGWLRQFEGFTGKADLEPGKEIDAISGATKSVQAITTDIQYRTKQLKKLTLQDR